MKTLHRIANLVAHPVCPSRPRSTALLALVMLAGPLFSQSYPGSIYVPLVAKDNLQTSLNQAMAIGDTTAFVASTTRWVPNTVLYICDQSTATRCTGTYEVMLVTAVPSANALTVTRGYGGTTAVAHASGKAVLNAPTAVYNTVLSNEVLAIETALGANLSNVPRASTINPVLYNFVTQSPAGTLSPGSNTITMTPVPLGVNGTDVGHRLYVATQGTPEACLINGGSGVAGQTSGQISISCANAHSAGWTINSATYGASEACVANSPCDLEYPGGTFDWYGTFWAAANTTIRGGGQGVTTLRWNNLNSKMLDIERDSFELNGIRLLQVGTAVAGNIGVYVAGAGSAVASATGNNGALRDVRTVGFYDGIYLHGGGGVFNLSDVTSTNSVHDGIVVRQMQGFWEMVNVIFSGGNGITNSAAATTGGYSPFMTGLQTYGNGGWGVYSTFWLQISGTPSFFNNDRLGELYMNLPAVSSAENGWISDTYIQYAGLAVAGGLPWATNTSAPGILVDTDSGPISISNNHFFSTQGNCINIKASFVSVIDNRMIGCGIGAQAGHVYGVIADSTHGFEIITNNYINAPNRIDGLYNIFRDNAVYANSAVPAVYVAAATSLVFDGNQIQQSGAGTAYTIDSGVTLMPGYNLPTVGTVSNAGTISANATPTGVEPRFSAASITSAKTENWIASETGSNNAIAGALLDSIGVAVPLSVGLKVTISLGHSLQAGANTLALNGGAAKAIRSSWNFANNIATACVAGSIVTLIYDGTEFQMVGQ